MYHSITFGDKNTWDDWHLIPSSRPVFNPPEPKTKFVDIPGADWHLDLSASLTGDVAYNGRTGNMEFIVDNGHNEWYRLYSEILEYLHGQTMRAILEDDPTHYYEGRFWIDSWKSQPQNSRIVIEYNVAPYRYELSTSLEDWHWDSFNFETGVVREYTDIRVDKSRVFTIPGDRLKVTPSFIVKSDDGKGLNLSFDGMSYNLPDGTSRVVTIRLGPGNNELIFTGNGTVSIEYRGGTL